MKNILNEVRSVLFVGVIFFLVVWPHLRFWHKMR